MNKVDVLMTQLNTQLLQSQLSSMETKNGTQDGAVCLGFFVCIFTCLN